MAKTELPSRPSQEQEVQNPGQSAWDELVNRPDMKALDDQMDAEAREQLREQEESPEEIDFGGLPAEEIAALQNAGALTDPNTGQMKYSPTGKSRRTIARGLLRNRKIIGGALGIGGGGALILALFMGMLPLKIEALLSNITTAASRIPGYAIEQRTEYLVTRALATRMLMMANGSASDVDGKLVFCGNASISCSLFSTLTADYFSKTMDFDVLKLSDGTNAAKLRIVPKGRTALGSTANSWDIDVVRGTNWKGEENVAKTIQTITKHKEMRAYLKDRVDKKMKNKSFITRYIARKILMKKYGVKHWRAFENTRDAIDTKMNAIESAFRVGVYKNTIGKISPRVAVYLACLQGGQSCQDLLDNFSSTITEPSTAERDKHPKDSPEWKAEDEKYQKALKSYESFSKLRGNILGEVPDKPSGFGAAFQKIISSKLLALAGTVVSAVMIIDMILTAVHSLDNGVLDEIGADIVSQTYMGFAYGEGTGVVTNWEKAKMDNFADLDAGEVVNQVGTLLDCGEDDPLCVIENGYAPSVAVASAASSGGYVTDCFIDGEFKKEVLAPGDLVCPNQKVYRNYSKLFANNPLFIAGKQIADVWFASGAHAIIELANNLLGAAVDAVLEATQLKQLLNSVSEWAMKQLEPFIATIMNYVFDPPPTGYDIPVSSNYAAVSGAMHIEQNELMLHGVEDDGTVSGGGGKVLSEEEIFAIADYQNQQEYERFAEKSWFERAFDPRLKGSVAQLAILQSPKNAEGVLSLPGQAFASLVAPLATQAAGPAPSNNAFNLPLSGYRLNDPDLTANPNQYTEEFCTASRQARIDSIKKIEGSSVPIPLPTKTDPCALEKLTTGSIITSANPKAEGAFPSAYTGSSAAPSAPGSGILGPADGSCDTRTEPIGSVTQMMRGMTTDAVSMQTVKLCALSSIKSIYPSPIAGANGRAIVRAEVSTAWQDMGEAYNTFAQTTDTGYKTLTVGDSFRTNALQNDRNDGGTADPGAAAPTGKSRHEQGIAMDIQIGVDLDAETWRTCTNRQTADTATYKWLRDNSYRFRIYQYAAEAWHFDTSTGDSRCQQP